MDLGDRSTDVMAAVSSLSVTARSWSLILTSAAKRHPGRAAGSWVAIKTHEHEHWMIQI
jgi:hypothetical protein